MDNFKNQKVYVNPNFNRTGTYFNKHFPHQAFGATQNTQRKIYINPNFMPVHDKINPHYVNLPQNAITEVLQNTIQTCQWDQYSNISNLQISNDRLCTESLETIRHTNENTYNKCQMTVNPFIKSRYCLVNSMPKPQTTDQIVQTHEEQRDVQIFTNTFKAKGLPAKSRSRYVLVRNNVVNSPKIKPATKNSTIIKISKYKMVNVDNFKTTLQLRKNNALVKPSLVIKSNTSAKTSKCALLTSPTNLLNNSLKFSKHYTNYRHLCSGTKLINQLSLSSYKTNSKSQAKKILKRSFKINNIPCPLYSKYGKCLRIVKGTCEYLHDKKHVSLCRKFLKGICHDDNCLLSHELSDKKMPTCYFYLKGMCTKEPCPYVHIKLSEKTKLCQDFLKGYCEKGEKCLHRHLKKLYSTKKLKCSLNKSDRTTPKPVKKFKCNFKPIVRRFSPGEGERNEKSEKDCRYYKDVASEDDQNCEIIKPMRCKLGTLPSFIQL